MLPFPRHKVDDPAWPHRVLIDLAAVAAEGFDRIEATDTWLNVGDLSEPRLGELRAAAEAHGLGIEALALIRRSVIDPRFGADNLAYSHRSIDAASCLGAGVVSIGLHEALQPAQREALWFWTEPGPRNDPADTRLWALAVARLRELGEHAAQAGIVLSLEMYEDTYLGTAELAVRLVEEIDRANVGLNPDTGNLVRLHRPIDDWRGVLEAVLPYSNYWHVKNYLRDEDRASGAIGTMPTSLELGLINYRWAVELAVRHGFAGPITCEHYGGDGLGVSATNRTYLRRILPAKTAPEADL
jgi:sugar phosphate isomerase/epimerase